VTSKSRVALARCERYEDAKHAIGGCLSRLGCLNLFRGKSVFLKVNLMKGAPPERAISTHPEFVRAMIQIVREQGGTVSVGDSSGVLGFTSEAFRASGIEAVCREEGAKLLNLDACVIVKKPVNGKVLDFIWTAENVLNADVLVTLPKLKTHSLTLLTGALKNQIGLLVGGTKCEVHLVAPRLREFAAAVADINAGVRFHLGVVDGIWGLEGGDSSKGWRKQSNLVAASTDLVALDAVCAHLMSIEPDEVLTTVAARERGLGTGTLSEIDVLGDSLESCRTSFARPGREMKRHPCIAKRIYRLRGRSLSPIALPDRCQKCRRCAELCPTRAIACDPYPRIDMAACIRCFACRENCPHGAMKLKCAWYLKPFYKRRAEGLALDALA